MCHPQSRGRWRTHGRRTVWPALPCTHLQPPPRRAQLDGGRCAGGRAPADCCTPHACRLHTCALQLNGKLCLISCTCMLAGGINIVITNTPDQIMAKAQNMALPPAVALLAGLLAAGASWRCCGHSSSRCQKQQLCCNFMPCAAFLAAGDQLSCFLCCTATLCAPPRRRCRPAAPRHWRRHGLPDVQLRRPSGCLPG